MPYMIAFSCMLMCAFGCYTACHFLIRLSHRHALLDSVNDRSSHTIPKARIGGLSFVVINSLVLAALMLAPEQNHPKWVYLALLIPPLLVALISTLEDISNKVSRTARLAAHVIAAALAVSLFCSGSTFTMTPLIFLLCVIAITWFINLYNFMDGIDGIAISQAAFIILTIAIVATNKQQHEWSTTLICLSGSLLGFLFINWQPAKIFMGDVGSTYLGLLIPVILLISLAKGSINLWVAIILTGTFLVDATWTLLARLLSGQAWYKPHRSHTYQILSRKLNSHARVSSLNAAVNLLWLLPLGLLANTLPNYGHFFTIIALFPLLLLVVFMKAGYETSN